MNNKTVICCIAFLFATTQVKAQEKFCKIWYTQGGESKVQIYLGADGKYYGKIVWMKAGFANGKPLLDKKNPDAAKRTQPMLGLVIITGLVKKSDTEVAGGKIYDPTKGNFYSCKMTVAGNKLELRGYIFGMPFLGRTTTWYLAEDNQQINTSASTPRPIIKH